LMMTVFIYPISGHWVWQGEGWLTNRVYRLCWINSCTLCRRMGALVAAIMVGPELRNILMESQMLFLATT
jgi:Amt family ammonium transporter